MENQSIDVKEMVEVAKQVEAEQREAQLEQMQLNASGEHVVQVHLNSPISEGQSFEFCKIQTGAHSLSSTDSDMAKAIQNANKDILESPPNLISPKGQIAMEAFQAGESKKVEHMQLAEEMSDFILAHLLREIKEEIPILVPRPNLAQPKTGPAIKFFDKKGIKTDLFAIEKYVDEVIEEVKINRPEFMEEINKPLSKKALEGLFHMQNSEIGSYDHFQQSYPSVLSLDLYLKLEKRRKESRESQNITQLKGPDGAFDFDKVEDHDLQQDGVNKNFLAEC